MYSKLLGSVGDADLALMALAGIRVLVHGSAAPTTGAAASYTVTDDNTRRVMFLHLGAGAPAAGDIRFRIGGTASAAYMPLIPQRYMVLSLVKDETVSFFNTSADTISIYAAEMM